MMNTVALELVVYLVQEGMEWAGMDPRLVGAFTALQFLAQWADSRRNMRVDPTRTGV